MSVFEDMIFLTVAKTFRYQLLLSTQKNSRLPLCIQSSYAQTKFGWDRTAYDRVLLSRNK